MPKLNSCIRGVAHIRGQTISVIDLSMAMGKRPIQDLSKCFIIISEYNRSIQGFLVHSVERIINMNWESILPPPKGAGRINYMTAVTEVDGELVEILDVERILNEISPVSTEVSTELGGSKRGAQSSRASRAGCGRLFGCAQAGSTCTGGYRGAVRAGQGWTGSAQHVVGDVQNGPIHDQIALVISDIEMPEMDGYTFTAEIRNNPNLKDLHVILHTSLSGVFNQAMVQKVGANNFIAKFQPDELAKAVQGAL